MEDYEKIAKAAVSAFGWNVEWLDICADDDVAPLSRFVFRRPWTGLWRRGACHVVANVPNMGLASGDWVNFLHIRVDRASAWRFLAEALMAGVCEIGRYSRRVPGEPIIADPVRIPAFSSLEELELKLAAGGKM